MSYVQLCSEARIHSLAELLCAALVGGGPSPPVPVQRLWPAAALGPRSLPPHWPLSLLLSPPSSVCGCRPWAGGGSATEGKAETLRESSMRERSRLCFAMYAFQSSAVVLVMLGPVHAAGCREA